LPKCAQRVNPTGVPYFRAIEFSDDQHQLVNQA
jgi:hypothetical protein